MLGQQSTDLESNVPSRTLRILVAEDNGVDCALMISAIRRHGYAVTHLRVDAPEVFRQALSENEYDVVLSDHDLQNWTGSDALEIVHLTGKDIPVIIVTGFLGDERAVAYLKQGAADYVVKDHLDRLPLAVSRALQERSQRAEKIKLQKRMEQAKEDWERTFDAIPDPILLLDRDGQIVRANRRTAKLFDVSLANLEGAPYYALTHRNQPPPPDYPVRRMMLSGRTEQGDVEDRRLGKIFHVSAIPLKDELGRITGAILEMVDITERKRAENAKTLLLNEVNLRVKNSFGVIGALLELQASQNSSNAAREALRVCERRIQCVSLVHEHIYRSESREHIDFDVFATHLGRRLFADMAVSAPDMRLDVQYSSLEVPMLQAGAVGIALEEMVANAIQHAFPEQRQGTIRVSLEESGPGMRRLLVADNGVGFAEPHSGQKKMGLKIIEAMARVLNGSFSIENSSGTRVSITFPATSPAASPAS